jgi:hypothetical protein
MPTIEWEDVILTPPVIHAALRQARENIRFIKTTRGSEFSNSAKILYTDLREVEDLLHRERRLTKYYGLKAREDKQALVMTVKYDTAAVRTLKRMQSLRGLEKETAVLAQRTRALPKSPSRTARLRTISQTEHQLREVQRNGVKKLEHQILAAVRVSKAQNMFEKLFRKHYVAKAMSAARYQEAEKEIRRDKYELKKLKHKLSVLKVGSLEYRMTMKKINRLKRRIKWKSESVAKKKAKDTKVVRNLAVEFQAAMTELHARAAKKNAKVEAARAKARAIAYAKAKAGGAKFQKFKMQAERQFRAALKSKERIPPQKWERLVQNTKEKFKAALASRDSKYSKLKGLFKKALDVPPMADGLEKAARSFSRLLTQHAEAVSKGTKTPADDVSWPRGLALKPPSAAASLKAMSKEDLLDKAARSLSRLLTERAEAKKKGPGLLNKAEMLFRKLRSKNTAGVSGHTTSKGSTTSRGSTSSSRMKSLFKKALLAKSPSV